MNYDYYRIGKTKSKGERFTFLSMSERGAGTFEHWVRSPKKHAFRPKCEEVAAAWVRKQASRAGNPGNGAKCPRRSVMACWRVKHAFSWVRNPKKHAFRPKCEGDGAARVRKQVSRAGNPGNGAKCPRRSRPHCPHTKSCNRCL